VATDGCNGGTLAVNKATSAAFLGADRGLPRMGAMTTTTNVPVPSASATLKLASYQKPTVPQERRAEGERSDRRADPRRATLGERRSAGQRVLRALFGT
jgi:hypothetical protein